MAKDDGQKHRRAPLGPTEREGGLPFHVRYSILLPSRKVASAGLPCSATGRSQPRWLSRSVYGAWDPMASQERVERCAWTRTASCRKRSRRSCRHRPLRKHTTTVRLRRRRFRFYFLLRRGRLLELDASVVRVLKRHAALTNRPAAPQAVWPHIGPFIARGASANAAPFVNAARPVRRRPVRRR